MGYKKDDPCIQKALDTERLFVLMARDPSAPETVVDWIGRSLKQQPPEKLHEALDCAIEMANTKDDIRSEIFQQRMDKGESPFKS